MRPEWLTIEQTAELLQLSTKTVRRMISRGDLEARRIGPRLIRVRNFEHDEIGRELVWRDE